SDALRALSPGGGVSRALKIAPNAAVITGYVGGGSFPRFCFVVVDRHKSQPCFFDLVGIAAGCSCVTGDLFPCHRKLRYRGAAAYEAIGPGASPFERNLGAAAGPDGRMRFLNGSRPDGEIFYLEELPLVGDVLFGPKTLD